MWYDILRLHLNSFRMDPKCHLCYKLLLSQPTRVNTNRTKPMSQISIKKHWFTVDRYPKCARLPRRRRSSTCSSSSSSCCCCCSCSSSITPPWGPMAEKIRQVASRRVLHIRHRRRPAGPLGSTLQRVFCMPPAIAICVLGTAVVNFAGCSPDLAGF